MGQEPERHVNKYADEVEHYRRMVDSTKSFNNAAMSTLLLYIFLWIPGSVANIVYLNEARSIQKRTGRGPEGKGCLVALLIVMGGLVGGGLCIWAFVIVSALST